MTGVIEYFQPGDFYYPAAGCIFPFSTHSRSVLKTHRMVVSGDTNRSGGNTGLFSSSRSRSEEHTSELQSRGHLVCRLLLEKKKQRDIHLGWSDRQSQEAV